MLQEEAEGELEKEAREERKRQRTLRDKQESRFDEVQNLECVQKIEII